MTNRKKELITAKNAEELVKVANSKGNVLSLHVFHNCKEFIIAQIEYRLTYDIATIAVPSKTSNWPDDSYFPKSDYKFGDLGFQTVCSGKQENPWEPLLKFKEEDDELAEEFADVLDSMRSKDSKPLPDLS